MRSRALLLVGLMLTPAAVHADERKFDYECNARSTAAGAPDLVVRSRFRVDLDLNLWCSGRCATPPSSIKSVSAEKLILADDRSDAARRLIAIDRKDGAYLGETDIMAGGGRIASSMAGSCTLAPFSGFPVTGAGRSGFRPSGPPPRPPGPPPRPPGF